MVSITISMAIISISWLSISRSLAIVSMVTISMTISMTVISIAGLSISGPLAIISMVSITTISIANMSIAISMTISISWLSSGSWLGISRSLAIISMVTISISMSITMAISMTIIAISRLGNSHTQEGKRNSNQNVHVDSSSFSTTLPMYSAPC